METVKKSPFVQRCVQFYYVVGTKGLSDAARAELRMEDEARGDLAFMEQDLPDRSALRSWSRRAAVAKAERSCVR